MNPSHNSIYLDNAAATPLDPRVLKSMMPYLESDFYNPSALYGPAQRAKQAIEEARVLAAKQIGVKPFELTFTAGATESINILIYGVMKQYGGEIVTTAIEHDAVLAAARRHAVIEVSVDERGYLAAGSIEAALTSETTLVSVGYVNNELGVVQSLRDVAAVIAAERQRRLRDNESRPLFFHTDASQAAGLLDISVSRLGVDAMSLNASKCYGPKQVGLLYKSPEIEIEPLIVGGGQENGLRSGTENVAGVVGFAQALELANEQRKIESHRIAELRDILQKNLTQRIPGLVINGHKKRRAPHILHISVPGLDGERAVFALDQVGIYAATGSACAANRMSRSHVLESVGMNTQLADGSLRLSLGRFTTEQEVQSAGKTIPDIITKELQL